MADIARLNELLHQLNDALGEITPYKLAVTAPAAIQPADKNAHYMTKRMFDQLVGNIRRDRNLASLPFCWQRSDGSFVALSGHHRIGAATAAGVDAILVLYTDAQLSKPERVAVQLSHNALVGQDNPVTLAELWREIDAIDLKVYSGLDDRLIAAALPPDFARLTAEPLHFEELRLLFLPHEMARIKEVVDRLGKFNHPRLAAPVEDFDRFFNALLSYKETADILNTATAFLSLIEIAADWLRDHTPEAQGHATD